ncbi:ubiquinone biosynthesis protein COQ9, mitochondrial [Selaginella moellendorffii]|uniref:ubiquinone biosynthesis protein COQ9, mitochondrial n=1 Tax=Selaginella moellendorffii TaxID=88036 RepID=UPI000D1C9E21|nr:ubiquinone biosynthesis protein COQ9, mitochondrial [Selaginella moellendorffii]|eukprot:XP_024541711.1 ubiquinone biosynthesis protein COQ9, mitochondrial [Selaginella moellendorffii]
MCKDAGKDAGVEDEKESHKHKASHESKKQKEKEEDDEKRRVLNAALTYVPTLGWTEAAIAAGARDVNLSPAILGAFHRKEAALVEYFMDESLDELTDAVEEQSEELEKLVLHERLAKVMRIRLEMQAPYISKWAQALSIQANPINLPVAMKQRAVLMDEIWHSVGDRSTDWDFYSKRAILGGVYTAAEVYMLTDYSPGFRDTWTFTERRIIDVIDCRKTAKEAAQLAQAIGAGLGNTIASFLKQPRPGP